MYLLATFGGHKSTLLQILTWISPKSWTHRLSMPYWEIFKIRNTDLEFRTLGNISMREEKPIAKRYAWRANAKNVIIKLLRKFFFDNKKTHGFFNIDIWDKWKCISLCFYSIICLFSNMYLRTTFPWCIVENIISLDAARKIKSRSNEIKNSSKEYVRKALEVLTNEKHFPKTISQGFLLMLTKLPRTIFVRDISPSSLKLKR